MTLDDRSGTAMTFDADHLATLNEAARTARDPIRRSTTLGDLSRYLVNNVSAILAQAAELATLRAKVEEAHSVQYVSGGREGFCEGPFFECVCGWHGLDLGVVPGVAAGPSVVAHLVARLAASTPDTGSET